MSTVVDNTAARRFELLEDGHLAFAAYRRSENLVTIPHVESAKELRGKGTASRLMTGIVALAREHSFKITPTCPYAIAWFRNHPEAEDVLI
ncbi:MAG: GNAT family N-acetyltransferase [Rhizomicrobium sp.]